MTLEPAPSAVHFQSLPSPASFKASVYFTGGTGKAGILFPVSTEHSHTKTPQNSLFNSSIYNISSIPISHHFKGRMPVMLSYTGIVAQVRHKAFKFIFLLFVFKLKFLKYVYRIL